MEEYIECVREQLLKCRVFLEDPEDPNLDANAAEAVDNILRATIAYYIREVGEGSDFVERILSIVRDD